MTRPDGSVVEYGYDARGWMADLTVDGPPPVVSYSHDARGRVTGHSFETGLQVVRDLDAAGQLESITNSLGTTVLSSFTYGYDLAGQRTHVLRADGKGDRYAYDAARQVTGADLDAPNPAINGTGAAASRSYAYDLAGNRTTAGEADLIANTSSSTAYTTNAVNAYTNVGGTAFTYDLDGNMTRGLARNDGTLNGPLVPMNLTWDAHNRLKTAAPVTAAAGRLRGTYTYDAQGRRILRVVEVYQSGTWVLQNTVRYSHDGWNMNYEVSVDAASQTTARRLTWGKDLSGSLQRAGGVGGLLMSETTTDGGTTWLPSYFLYDGNGNVSTVVDGTGAVLASYTYDPYGRVVASSGPQATTNVWRFSTKPVDAETGWSYYGCRHYSTELGRWPSRDPITERGGMNLYSFVSNDPISGYDLVGLLDDPWKFGPEMGTYSGAYQSGNCFSCAATGHPGGAPLDPTENGLRWGGCHAVPEGPCGPDEHEALIYQYEGDQPVFENPMADYHAIGENPHGTGYHQQAGRAQPGFPLSPYYKDITNPDQAARCYMDRILPKRSNEKLVSKRYCCKNAKGPL